jgi:hypothetical protein
MIKRIAAIPDDSTIAGADHRVHALVEPKQSAGSAPTGGNWPMP